MIAATIFLGLLAYTLWRFGLQRATTRKQVTQLVPAFVTFGLLLMLTAAFSLSEYFDAREPRLLTPQTTLPADVDGRVVLFAAISDNVRFEDPITVQLSDTEHTFPNTDYIAGNWRNRPPNNRFLSEGDALIVVAREVDDKWHVQFVYRGEHEDFLSFYQRFTFLPMTTMIVSFVMAILVILIAVPYYRRLEK